MSGIEATARWAAAVRAIETSRPDASFDDPLAAALALSYKQGLLVSACAHPSCERQVYLAADLRGANWPAQMAQAGFDPSAPKVWLAEGLLFYLPDEAIETLLAQVSALASTGDLLGFDIPNRAVLTHPFMQAWLQMQADAGAATKKGS
jgi:methyltransferase (TIGR00027 family)